MLTWYRLRVLVFNCTHERNPANLLAPLAELPVVFDAAVFVPNVAGLADLGPDQADKSTPGDPALGDQHRMRDLWLAAVGPDRAREAHVVPSVAAAVAWAEQLRDRTGRPVEVVVTGSLLLGGVAAAVLQKRFGVDIVAAP